MKSAAFLALVLVTLIAPQVRTVVASLWSVGDESTKEFMVAFYKELAAGASKTAALQTAQVALMKNPKYSRPLYWAPFVLMGDWR